MVEDQKFSKVDLYGVGNMLITLLKQGNMFGQRVDIVIEIPRKDREGTVTFISGWMVKPNGKLILTTP